MLFVGKDGSFRQYDNLVDALDEIPDHVTYKIFRDREIFYDHLPFLGGWIVEISVHGIERRLGQIYPPDTPTAEVWFLGTLDIFSNLEIEVHRCVDGSYKRLC